MATPCVRAILRSRRAHQFRRLRCAAGCFLFLLLAHLSWAADAPNATGDAAPAAKMFHWHPFLAPFHSVMLHLPIGFVMMAFILEIYRLRRPSEDLKRVVSLVIWLSLLSGISTAALGVLRAGGGGYEPHAVELHR